MNKEPLAAPATTYCPSGLNSAPPKLPPPHLSHAWRWDMEMEMEMAIGVEKVMEMVIGTMVMRIEMVIMGMGVRIEMGTNLNILSEIFESTL